MMKLWIYLAAVLALLGGCAQHEHPELKSVDRVDLLKYKGLWYEIARYENRFEEGCIGASAYYTLNEAHIDVLNRCYDENGKLIGQANGKAYAIEGSNNSRLQVTFFWPFYGDYWVFMLADDYRYSVVGDPERKYLWILSRTKKISAADKEAILQSLPEFGYEPARLIWTSLDKI